MENKNNFSSHERLIFKKVTTKVIKHRYFDIIIKILRFFENNFAIIISKNKYKEEFK